MGDAFKQRPVRFHENGLGEGGGRGAARRSAARATGGDGCNRPALSERMAEPAVGAGPPERAAPAPAPAAGRLVPDSGAVDEESEDRKNVHSATVPVGEPAHRNPGTEDSSAASSPLARLTALNPFGRELKPAERAGDPGAGAAASSVLPGPWLTVRCHPLRPDAPECLPQHGYCVAPSA